MAEVWTKKQIEERILLLSRKYYPGYVDKNPKAPIYVFMRALEKLNESGAETISINFDGKDNS